MLLRAALLLFSLAIAPAPTTLAQDARMPALDSLLQAIVDSGHVGGAAIQVKQDGRVLHRAAYGYARKYGYGMAPLDQPEPLTTEHLFDLASLTKVFGTTFGIMMLVDRGRIELGAPVYRYLPEFRGPSKDSVTVRHLLTHTSGLSQWEPTYYHASTPAGVYDFIVKRPLSYPVGAARHYSDLGFMLLGFIIERVGGEPLDAFLHDNLYEPLGLSNTMYRPLDHGIKPERIAATSHGNAFERRMVYDDSFGYDVDVDPKSWDGWRTYLLRGEVNDGNAFYAHGGVAGHAGLFSTIDDLQRLVDLLLDGGSTGDSTILSAEVIRTFTTSDEYGNGLGWAMDPDAIHTRGAPDGTFGHTGFTGTNVVLMPALGASIILLTNRQHVDDSGAYYNVNPVRREVFRLVLRHIARAPADP